MERIRQWRHSKFRFPKSIPRMSRLWRAELETPFRSEALMSREW